MHVMAGVLVDPAGRVLLAQRPPGKHLAGAWEFPGGKLEPGEAAGDGLARELAEELGIAISPGEPLTRVPWAYGAKRLLLDAWVVRRWDSEPRPLEHTALQWADPDAVDLALLAPADRAILQALRLPHRYPITPADLPPAAHDACAAMLRDALARGERLLQLRLPLWPIEQVRALAGQLLPEARSRGARLLLNGDIEGALALGVGVQLKAAQLSGSERPLSWNQPVGASCHDAAELARALALGADFATVSPVAVTATHPELPALGWAAFAALAETAALPVYALGGMNQADVQQARTSGGQGIAGIRGFWGG
ncbi:Nudix family hydrolase [Dyella sp. LX-66]|nr:Nudix family hydrolase [Dyella sp. LX-1]MBT2141173.1 Nudix family hydrolase [Dyella sp. LX-66]